MRGTVAWPLAALPVLLLAFASSAQVVVYHSPNDDGVNPMAPAQLPVGPWESLYLYLDTGPGGTTSAGLDACFNGDGSEICGFEVTLDAMGGASFVDFIPDANIVHKLTPTQLKANGVFSLDPTIGHLRIGELKVASSQPGGEVMMSAGTGIGAALQVVTIPTLVIATTPAPEPGMGAMLAAGSLLLAALARRRAASGSGTP